KAIDFVINWIVTTAKSLFKALFGKKDAKPDERTPAQKQADLDNGIAEADKYLEDDNLDPSDVSKKLATIQATYRLTSLTLVVDAQTEEEETDHVEGTVNPGKKTPKKKRIVRMPKVSVSFDCDTNEFDPGEYQDQLSGQQSGLNKLQVDKWAGNRAAYVARAAAGGSGRDPKGATAQKKFREQERTRLIAENIAAGMTPRQAEREVAKFMKTQAALHDPDQIAGGDPTKIKKLGSKYINSSIGSQWKTNVADLDTAVGKIAPARRPKLHMNVTLKMKRI
ncbi:MAG TPA: polymorphic toxin type 15 domain-containing protein, partial [Candidatus Angelobacter sp.]|nr:polymorphic toxin type 15 domain-containing protein [Candidatus Angelobacter sp.]